VNEQVISETSVCSQSLALVPTNQNNQQTEHVQNTNQWNLQNGRNKQQYKSLKKPIG